MILDQKKDTVAAFQTLRKFGMGNFMLTPQAGSAYTAICRIRDSVFSQALPSVYDQGFVMSLSEKEEDKIQIIVSSNVRPNNSQVFLFVHANQLVRNIQASEVTDGKASFTLSKKSMDEGISGITLFNADRKPVCERLYYKKPERKMLLQSKTDQTIYTARKKVTINLQSTDQLNQPVKADMSMSVFMIDSLQSIPAENILNYLLLTSDLKGRIESPEYYFENNDAEAGKALDNLMLTQGWRRFRWEDILQDKTPLFEFLPEAEGPIINGKVIDKKSGNAAQNKTAYLSIPGRYFEFRSSVSRQDGTVRFNPTNFYGQNEIIIQTNSQADSNYSVEIANPYSELFSSTTLPNVSLPERWKKLLEFHSTNAQVENSYLVERKSRYLIPEIKDTTAFFGNPDRKYFLDEYTRFITMEEVMREYIIDVRVRKQSDKFYFRVMNDLFNTYFEDGPMVLIDGMPVFDVNRIMTFDPLKIKQIEIVAHKYNMGSLITDGIVSYRTYNGDLAGYDLDPNAVVLQYEGLQQQREFYSPAYPQDAQPGNRIPDFRNVLQWSPEIKTGADGRKQVSFYTSDLAGKFAIIIQGITDDGLPGSAISTFTVSQ